jgi:hypothetical protein
MAQAAGAGAGARTAAVVPMRMLSAIGAGTANAQSADAYMFAAPEALAAMSALMKNAFDRTCCAASDRINGQTSSRSRVGAEASGGRLPRYLQRRRAGLEQGPDLLAQIGRDLVSVNCNGMLHRNLGGQGWTNPSSSETLRARNHWRRRPVGVPDRARRIALSQGVHDGAHSCQTQGSRASFHVCR